MKAKSDFVQGYSRLLSGGSIVLVLTTVLLLGVSPVQAESESGGFVFGGGNQSGGFSPIGTASGNQSGGVGMVGGTSESGGPTDTGAVSDSGGTLELGNNSESGGPDLQGNTDANRLIVRNYRW